MSVIVKKQRSMFFSSDPRNGAKNVSNDGSSFTVALNSPLSIPKGAVMCELGVSQASIWNTSPNISPSFENNLFGYSARKNV